MYAPPRSPAPSSVASRQSTNQSHHVVVLFVQSFNRSFIRSFVHLFVCSSVRSFVRCWQPPNHPPPTGPRSSEHTEGMTEAARSGGVGALRHAVFALGNLGVMDGNKHLLLKAGAVDELVRLTVHSDEELRKVSVLRCALFVLFVVDGACQHHWLWLWLWVVVVVTGGRCAGPA